MAELGIAASGIGIASLTLQVGDCIVRLKGFWDAVKDAPEDIKHLIEEIETLSSVLSDFETGEQPELNLERESTSICLQFCKKAVGILDSVVKDAEANIKKRKRVGSMKAVLKRDVIEKLRKRLVTAQSMLMLSNNMYLVELQKRNRQAHHEWAEAHQQELQQLRVIVSQSTETILCSARFQDPEKQLLTAVETTPPVVESESLSTNKPGLECQKFTRGAKRQQKLKARFQTPKWLFGVSRAIEIYECRVHAGWNFNIQVYNVVPYDSPIFEMAENGDVIGIQDLFRAGKASPFDRTRRGYTILDKAAYAQKLDVCRFLMNEGADPNISFRGSALVEACWCSHTCTSTNAFHDIVQLLAQGLELLDFFESPPYDKVVFRGDAEIFAWLLQASNSTYQQQTVEDCVLFALNICSIGEQPHKARLVRTILKRREIDEYVCGVRDKNGRTLLHCAASNLGEFLSGKFNKLEARIEDLFHLINDLVKGRSGLNAPAYLGTPMLYVIEGYLEHSSPDCFIYDECSNRLSRKSPPMPLRIWLEQLKGSGVDLVEYGKEEKCVLERAAYTIREWYYWEFNRRKRWETFGSRLHLINFTYGPEPDDWKFWFAPVMKGYFMDFWDMIDHPERAMPGAWQEEDYRPYY